MTIEHIERDCSALGASNVCKTIQQKFGVEVIVTTVGSYFDVEKEYVIEWDKKEIEGVEFYFCVLTI